MSLVFKAKTEKQAKEDMLVPAGEYDFEVVKAEAKDSSKGNPMIALNLKVFSGEGTGYVNDWLMVGTASMEYKLRHFCMAVGLEAEYQKGTLSAQDCLNRSGRVKLGQKDDPTYGPQNTVKDYIVQDAAKAESNAAPAPSVNMDVPPKKAPIIAPDDIPF